MSKKSETNMPGNLKGYKLKKVHPNIFGRVIIWTIIILVILWFVNRQIIFDLLNFLNGMISIFLNN